jgi:general secretion pathway protein I
MPTRTVARGMTLLEVLVAVAVLAIGLTVVLTAQTGLFSSGQHAHNLSLATGLARCRMSEVEVQLLRDGFPISDIEEQGPCCEEEDESQFRCHWEVESVMLPDLDVNLGDGGALDPTGSNSATTSALTQGLEPISGARDSFVKGNASEAFGGLSGAMPPGMMGGPSAGAGAVASMAMGMIYPALKEMLEASIRRVEVQVLWREGSQERNLTLVQYLTNPQQGGFAETVGGIAGAGGASATGTSLTDSQLLRQSTRSAGPVGTP